MFHPSFSLKNWRLRLMAFLPFLILVGTLLLVFKGVRAHTQSWYFQDETEHVTVGWMVTKYGRQLYQDLSTNHQPIPVLVGGLLSKVIPYNTLFELIERLRLSMWFFWCVATLFVVWRFKWRGVMSATLLLSLSYYYFGFHVLAESLVAPAVLFLSLLLWEKIWPDTSSGNEKPAQRANVKIKNSSKSQAKLSPAFPPFQFPKITALDGILAGICCGVIQLSLLPLWPFLLGWAIVFFCRVRGFQKWAWLGSWAGVLALIFVVISPVDWIRETITNNVKYFLPFEGHFGVGDYLSFLIYPFLSLGSLNTEIGRAFAGLTILGLMTIPWLRLQQTWLKLQGQFKSARASARPQLFWSKHLLPLLPSLFFFGSGVGLLFLLNNRVSRFPAAFYVGFHLLPYLAYLCGLVGVLIHHFWLNPKTARTAKKLVLILLVVTLINNLGWVGEKVDKMNVHFIQYGEFQAYASALKVISTPGNTLLTGPDGRGYTNMLADVPLFGKQNFYLPWSYRVPELREYFERELQEHPPTFVYFNLDTDSHSQVLKPLLDQEYVQLKRGDGKLTQLYLQKAQMKEISATQWAEFEHLYFEVPR